MAYHTPAGPRAARRSAWRARETGTGGPTPGPAPCTLSGCGTGRRLRPVRLWLIHRLLGRPLRDPEDRRHDSGRRRPVQRGSFPSDHGRRAPRRCVATPSYAIRLGQVAAEMGVDLARDTPGRARCCWPASRAPTSRPEGAHRATSGGPRGRLHGHDGDGRDHRLRVQRAPARSTSPRTTSSKSYSTRKPASPLPLGEVGERVCTAFGIGLIPIIRYRTGDLVRRVRASHCPCGRTFELYLGGMIGRADDMRDRSRHQRPSVSGRGRRAASTPRSREFRVVLSRRQEQDDVAVELSHTPRPTTSWPRISLYA